MVCILAHDPVLPQQAGFVRGCGADCLIDLLGSDTVWTGDTALCIKFILHFLQFVLQNTHSFLKMFAFFHCISHSKMLKKLSSNHANANAHCMMNKMAQMICNIILASIIMHDVIMHDVMFHYCDLIC